MYRFWMIVEEAMVSFVLLVLWMYDLESNLYFYTGLPKFAWSVLFSGAGNSGNH